MKVKNKILLTLIPVVLFSTILINFSFGLFFQNYIIKQEDNQINSAMASLYSYINEREGKYLGSVNDWGHWDDTYNFIDNKNPEYIDLNMKDSTTYTNLDISFFILTNNKDEIVYNQFYSFENNAFTQFPKSFFNDFNSILSLLKQGDDTSSIIKVGGDFYFLASTEVTDSSLTKPMNGRMIIGRLIDSSIIKGIEKTTGCKLSKVI